MGNMFRTCLGLFLIAICSATAVSANPGMWTFDQFKAAYKAVHGEEPPEELVNAMMYSMVRVSSGGSASFVSPHGLVITNHHVAESALGQLAKERKNIVAEGYSARSQAEELKIPSYEMNAFIGLEDITEQVEAAVKPGMTHAQAAAARNRVIAQIEEKVFNETGAKAQVVGLYDGTKFQLYRFKRYTDVRLVWAPEKQSGFYGGDKANFNYPRTALDGALFRVYENGKPISTPNYIPVSPYGSREGENLFIVGNPGSTSRHLTAAQLPFVKDIVVPTEIEMLEARETALIDYSALGAEQKRQALSDLDRVQNVLKVKRGGLEGFTTGDVIARRQKWESGEGNPAVNAENKSEWTAALDKIAAAQKVYESLFDSLFLIGDGRNFAGDAGLFSGYFGHARDMVRIAEERTKSVEGRPLRFRPSNRPSLMAELSSSREFFPALDEVKLKASLAWMIKRFGEKNPMVAIIMDGKSVADRAKELSNSEVLQSPEKRTALFLSIESGETAIEKVNEPWIILAAKLRAAQKSMAEFYENEVVGPSREAMKTIVAIRSKAEMVYPDATFSPRISFGEVAGYVELGVKMPAYTNFGNFFDQAVAQGNRGDWEVPKSWMEARANGRINDSTPFNMVSRHDTTGGNSGSPVLNRFGHLVGLLFDGNAHESGQEKYAVPNHEVGRSVTVCSTALVAALAGVYQVNYIDDELRAAWRAKTQPNQGS